ncbi:hypothetical protein PQ460_03410 [Paenibacillus sp. KACC 21273]|uniref:sulfotransferase family protein n=1 Tax=Paenibacillus sp. KACC 21273 TaxID=3025665 RepID=UPI002366E253|nr:hypothetical protein [Paenibacillus sp. KACC 21273]WDF51526.1 hypothetical protein PQ460_03410 [Paenibacillus sp. KACC 21273]
MINKANSRAICILGMHRSGTSAIARSINLLGVYLGESENLLSAQEDNPHGFWEHLNIIDIQNRILWELGVSWDTPVPLEELWWKKPEMIPFRNEIKQFINQQMISQNLWAWKDPRTCLLLPLWLDILQELDVEVNFVISIRNPLDIANSLLKRNNIPIQKSLGIWMNYMISVARWTADSKCILVSYDEFLDDWHHQLFNLSQQLNLPWPENELELKEKMQKFINPQFRHSYSSSDQLKETISLKPFFNLYDIYLKKINFQLDYTLPQIEEIASEYKTYAALFDIANLTKIELRQRVELIDTRHNIQHYLEELQEVQTQLKSQQNEQKKINTFLNNSLISGKDIEEKILNLENMISALREDQHNLQQILQSRGWNYLKKYYIYRDLLFSKLKKITKKHSSK